ncbi:hypothetical protein BDR22DRAFT_810135 [Usnea florida]
MYEYPSKDIYASLRNPPFALPRRILTFLTVIVPFTIFWTLLSYDRLPSFLSSGPSSTPSISHWQGWANVENMFVFGDSYTSTDFDPKKERPTPSNPFGNPPLPKSSSLDQKWIHYLTLNYNNSVINTYNMASYGATMDGFARFYHEHYMPHYGIRNHTDAVGWNASNTLFATFFGINDVRRCTDQPLTKDDCSEIFTSLFAIYAFLLEQLYQTGARNFLLLDIPPLNLLPFSHKWGHPVPPPAIILWNTMLSALATQLSTTHPDATIFQYSTHTLFTSVIADPTSYPPTALYVNTTNNCEVYRDAREKGVFKEECGVAVERYLWRDALHPTTGVQEAMAGGIARMLEGPGGRG